MKHHTRALICLLLMVSLLFALLSCSLSGERLVADRGYMNTRQEALTLPRPTESKDYFFYTAIVDIDAGNHVRTLICHYDGTTELHLSTGEAYAGLEIYDPTIATMAQDLLMGLSLRTDYIYWQAKTDLALPNTGCHSIYATGDNGIYRLELSPEKIPSEPVGEIYELYMALYEAVLSLTIEDSTAVSKAAQPMNGCAVFNRAF